MTILSVSDLGVRVQGSRGSGDVVAGVSFEIHERETLGLVGESGSGKSMTALAIIGLLPRACEVTSGEVIFSGKDLLVLPETKRRQMRGRHISLILQDPLTALDPAFTIGHQLGEVLRVHKGLRGRRARHAAVELLELLRIDKPEKRLTSYPHQLSGGMRQRVVGAIALAGEPDVLLADEPTTSLDVTVQAAYLALLKSIQRERGLAILFITHDFGVVRQMCDFVAVMYAGTIVERGPTGDLLAKPAHPYTKALIESVPDVRSKPVRLSAIRGAPASAFARPPGCRFASRCPFVLERCREEEPREEPVAPRRGVRCWRWREIG